MSEKIMFEGTLAAPITPFTKSDDVDINSLYDHCTDLIEEGGIDGLVFNALNGEGPNIEPDDRNYIKIVMEDLKKNYSNVKILDSVLKPTGDDIIESIDYVAFDLVDAFLLAPPTDERLNDHQMIDIIRNVCNKIPNNKGFILYNTGISPYSNPQNNKINAATLSSIYNISNGKFFGVKSTSDTSLIDDICEKTHEGKAFSLDYQYFEGNDRNLEYSLKKLNVLREADLYKYSNANISGASNITGLARITKCLYEAINQGMDNLAGEIQEFMTNSFDIVLRNTCNYMEPNAKSNGEPPIWKTMISKRIKSVSPYVRSPLIQVGEESGVLKAYVSFIETCADYFENKLET